MALWFTITLVVFASVATILFIGWLCLIALMMKPLDHIHMADSE